jgi:hypothetical protein
VRHPQPNSTAPSQAGPYFVFIVAVAVLASSD